MNTKKFFMLLAAVLLGSVSAFAQSGNDNPLNGDVARNIKNVEEHYFYLGTIKPTAENYKIIPGSVTSYTFIDQAMGTTASVEAGQTLYLLCPAEWIARRNVVVEDNSGETISFSEDIDDTTISGYVIRKTHVWNEPSTITLKICNFYMSSSASNTRTEYDASILNEYRDTPPTSFNITPATDSTMFLMIYPAEWGEIDTCKTNGESAMGFDHMEDGIMTLPTGYKALARTTSINETITDIVWLRGTGIGLTPALSKGEGAIYNVSGQRLSKPQRGIYIKDGKKFVK